MIGRKIGFTNPVIWREFDLDTPIWAPMYEQTVHFAEQGRFRLSLAGMVAPRIEPEIVLKLRRPASVGDAPAEKWADCLEWAAVGFEVVDSHYPDWRFTAAEAVADFGVHAALVVGTPWRVDSEDPHHIAAMLQTLKVTLRGGKDFVVEGEGRNALGSPLLALGFLARVLAAQAWAPLTPGEVITTGTLTAVPYFAAVNPTAWKSQGRPWRRCIWNWANNMSVAATLPSSVLARLGVDCPILANRGAGQS